MNDEQFAELMGEIRGMRMDIGVMVFMSIITAICVFFILVLP